MITLKLIHLQQRLQIYLMVSFLSSVNLGTTVGTLIAGLFIATLGSNYVILIGILACFINVAMIVVRNNMMKYNEQCS